jgi:putative tricarboxylic transport membrane protein
MRTTTPHMTRGRWFLRLFAAACGLTLAASAWGQAAWYPTKAVEIILPTAAGGANDQMARTIQKILQDQKLVRTPIVVMNKAGGNQTLGAVYLRQNAKDPHYLLYSTSSVFTTQITGLTQQVYTDLAPIALLMKEYSVISVHADSPIKSVRDMLARLKADPQSLSFGIVSRGGSNHVGLSQVAKSAGIDPKQLRIIVFKTNVESYLAVAGGHIQAVASSSTAAIPFVQQGNARILAIGAPQRQQGPLAQVPTFRDEGINVQLTTNWRGIFGAPGLTAPQSAFWEDALSKMAATEEWKKPLDPNEVGRVFLRGRDFAKFLETEYQTSKTILTDLGYAKH